MAVKAADRNHRSASLDIGHDGVGVLQIHVQDEPVNVINQVLLEDLETAVAAAESAARTSLTGLILMSTKTSGFLAGADVRLIRSAETEAEAVRASRRLQSICDMIEGLPVVTVAAIHGPALGGGLELALSCAYRVAACSRKREIGLVEIKLGLIPGGGGTFRLPRVTGTRRAISLICAGTRLTPRSAVAAGIIDEVVDERVLLATAREYVSKARSRRPKKLPFGERIIESNRLFRSLTYRASARRIEARTKGFYAAPRLGLMAIREGREHGRQQGMAFESETFGKLTMSASTRNLIDIFIASSDLERSQARDVSSRRISSIGVVGAGLMGVGIAQSAAVNGITVRLQDISPQAVAQGLARVQRLTAAARRRDRLSVHEARRVNDRVVGATTSLDLAGSQLVVEAATEDLYIKRDIVAKLESVLAEDAVIGTNTSALRIADITVDSERPERVVGIHFFSPVDRMPLVEVVRSPSSSTEAVETAIQFGRQMKKHVVVVADGPGFFTTRVLGFMLAEAGRLFEEGSSIQSIDGAMVGFGFPVGPMALMDDVGIDVATHVALTLQEAFPGRLGESMLLERMKLSGFGGRKSGCGFYRYGKRGRKPNPDVLSMANRESRQSSVDGIQERLSLMFLNEAAHCLSEGIIENAREGDLAAVYGLGFPPFLGGPFRYLDLLGTEAVRNRMLVLKEVHGDRYMPAPSIVECAAEKRPFRRSSGSVRARAKNSSSGRIIGIV